MQETQGLKSGKGGCSLHNLLVFQAGVNFTGLKFPSTGEIFPPKFCRPVCRHVTSVSQAWDTPTNFATGDTNPQGFVGVSAAAISAWSQALAVL